MSSVWGIVNNECMKRGKVHLLVGTKKKSVRSRLEVFRLFMSGATCSVSELLIWTTDGIMMATSLNAKSISGMSNPLRRQFVNLSSLSTCDTLLFVRADQSRVAVYVLSLCHRLYIIRHTFLIMSLQFCLIFLVTVFMFTFIYWYWLRSLHLTLGISAGERWPSISKTRNWFIPLKNVLDSIAIVFFSRDI